LLVNIAPGHDQHANGGKARNQHGQADLRQHGGKMVNIDHYMKTIIWSGEWLVGDWVVGDGRLVRSLHPMGQMR
jgi:hypothetical protein